MKKRRTYQTNSTEFKQLIKSAVKELQGENEEASVQDIIKAALDCADEKRKARKEAGEDVGELTEQELLEAVEEVIAVESEEPLEGEKDDTPEDEEKADDEEDEAKEDEDEEEEPKSRKGSVQRKARPSAQVQRKYSSIFLAAPRSAKGRKQVPADVQLARAIKCFDVFGRHDPEAAAFYAKKHYTDDGMAREFKALSATSPSGGGYLIPEIYLDQIIELLYSKTVIFELGAQKVPMANGNLNIPKMTSGARATWGGEQRKIAKTQPSFGNIKMSAKRLEAIVPQTRELLMSTSFSADQMFANDLTRKMELGLDFGALFGKGGEFQPTGITVHKDVEKIDAKALDNDLSDSTGKITADFPVFIRSKVLAKNVDDLHLGWTFNSVLEGYLMNMKTTTGAYIYREEMGGGKLLGFPYKVSNQISTSDTGLTDIIFGNWNDLLIGEQLGLETYTALEACWLDEDGQQHNAFEENLSATRALMYVDIAARHAESFIHCKNIKAI